MALVVTLQLLEYTLEEKAIIILLLHFTKILKHGDFKARRWLSFAPAKTTSFCQLIRYFRQRKQILYDNKDMENNYKNDSEYSSCQLVKYLPPTIIGKLKRLVATKTADNFTTN